MCLQFSSALAQGAGSQWETGSSPGAAGSPWPQGSHGGPGGLPGQGVRGEGAAEGLRSCAGPAGPMQSPWGLRGVRGHSDRKQAKKTRSSTLLPPSKDFCSLPGRAQRPGVAAYWSLWAVPYMGAS